jgi:Putative peptidoglycan binding domain/Glycine zipper 2TM domain
MRRNMEDADMPTPSKALLVSVALVVSACESGAGGGGGGGAAPARPALGTVGGAAAGGVLGSMVGSGRGRTAAIVGGAVLGGVAGNQLVDRPVEERERQQAEASRDRDMQRRLDFERQSALQQDQVQREIEERRLFEEWQRERAGGSLSGAAAATGSGDVTAAQRYLIALGYYNGPIDGVAGPGTRSAVQRFQANRGLAQTGTITPDLVQEMRRAL